MAKRANAAVALLLACALPAQAAEPRDELFMEARPAVTDKAPDAMRTGLLSTVRPLVAQAAPRRPTDSPLREPALALGIGRAGKQGIVERSVEAYTEVLIQCQQNKSPILTVPFQRSDSQQAHCYRF